MQALSASGDSSGILLPGSTDSGVADWLLFRAWETTVASRAVLALSFAAAMYSFQRMLKVDAAIGSLRFFAICCITL